MSAQQCSKIANSLRFRRQGRQQRDILPMPTKAGASTVNPTAQANLRLTDGLVGLRCPEDFDIDGSIVIGRSPGPGAGQVLSRNVRIVARSQR
jgi:hypothetical protein